MFPSFNKACAVFAANKPVDPSSFERDPKPAPRALPVLQVWNASGDLLLARYHAARDLAWKAVVGELRTHPSHAAVGTTAQATAPAERVGAPAPSAPPQSAVMRHPDTPGGRLYPVLTDSLRRPYPELSHLANPVKAHSGKCVGEGFVYFEGTNMKRGVPASISALVA